MRPGILRDPVVRLSVRPDQAQAHVYHWRGRHWRIRLRLFRLLNSLVPALMFLAVMLSFVPHRLIFGPQAALFAECFTPRLRYSGTAIGFHLTAITGGGPAPLIATALLAWTGSGYAIADYIALTAIISIAATLLMPDHINKDISHEHV